MATKQTAKAATDFERVGGESFTDNDEQYGEIDVRPEKPAPTKVYFYPLPNYAADRRYDPRARDTENAITLPHADGYFENFRRIASPGYYFMEFRAGREILGGEVVEVAPNTRADNAQPPAQYPTATQPSSPQFSENVAANALSGATAAVRETKELMREIMPQPTAPAPMSREEIAEMISRGITEGLRQAQPAQPTTNQPDPFNLIERTVALLEKMRPPQTEREESKSPIETLDMVAGIMEKMSDVSERVNPSEGGGGFGGAMRGIASVIEALGVKDVVRPIGKAIVSNAISQKMGVPAPIQAGEREPVAPEATQPQPASWRAMPDAESEGESEELTFELLCYRIKDDLISGNTPEESIADCVRFCAENPEELPNVMQLLAQSNEVLIVALCQVTNTDLRIIAGVEKFVEKLKAGVRKRLAPVPVVSNNGAHSAPPMFDTTQSDETIQPS